MGCLEFNDASNDSTDTDPTFKTSDPDWPHSSQLDRFTASLMVNLTADSAGPAPTAAAAGGGNKDAGCTGPVALLRSLSHAPVCRRSDEAGWIMGVVWRHWGDHSCKLVETGDRPCGLLQKSRLS